VSTTVELTLQINGSNPPIKTHLQTHPELHELHPELYLQVIRRSTREKLLSFKLRLAFPVRIQAITELTSYREAIKHPCYSGQWQKAMEEELKALNRNKTWNLMDKDTALKSGKRVIGCK